MKLTKEEREILESIENNEWSRVAESRSAFSVLLVSVLRFAFPDLRSLRKRSA